MATIYQKNAIMLEDGIVDLICIGIDVKPLGALHMYLCKNGIGVSMKVAHYREHVQFRLTQVTREDSGNYSCIYSAKKLHPNNVSSANENYIFIDVEGNV